MPAFATPLSVSSSTRTRRSVSVSRRPIRMAESPTRRVLVPVANGSEEIEASTVVDTLRRAGAEVTVASVEEGRTVCMSRGLNVCADTLISDANDEYDLIALPGGMPGAERLRDSAVLVKKVKDAVNAGKSIAAICAAPSVVLAHHGLINDVDATCYPAPAFREAMPHVADGDVVVSPPFITATGPGTALKWSLAIVHHLYSKELADKLANAMLVSV